MTSAPMVIVPKNVMVVRVNQCAVPVLNVVGGGLDQLVEQKCKQNIACCQGSSATSVRAPFGSCVEKFVLLTTITERKSCRCCCSLRCPRLASLNYTRDDDLPDSMVFMGTLPPNWRGSSWSSIQSPAYIHVHFTALARAFLLFRLIEASMTQMASCQPL